MPVSGGCKFKQRLLALKKLPPSADELTREIRLSISAADPFTTGHLPFDANLTIDAIILALLTGKVTPMGDDGIKILTVMGNGGVITYAAWNVMTKKVVLSIDFDGSEDVISHNGSLKTMEELMPGEVRILQHICPLDNFGGVSPKWTPEISPNSPDIDGNRVNSSNRKPPPKISTSTKCCIIC
jgi:hypothetical protein